ncbi:MAG: amidase, partial [Acidobacteriales bacterium]|nr:amidase [Terriglobales bacterium]
MTPRSIIAALATFAVAAACQDRSAPATAAPNAAVDRDLLDVTVPRLRQLYADKKYTVIDVVKWHLDRIDRYNGVYGAIETVLR